jgi:RimJ/RimL family protein N-acetyltransferase
MTADPWPPSVTLRGDHAILAPLDRAHGPALAEAVTDGSLWELWVTSVPTPDGVPAEIERRLGLREQGSCLPFTVIEARTGEPVGMTTYMNIDAVNSRLEIGATWYRGAVQRTPLNTECKLMLLRHAFETLECIAVEFRTHFFNTASRRAIERLGAKLDGVLRSHTVGRAGELRDTCVYSIIASEWPAVRQNLTWRLGRTGRG